MIIIKEEAIEIITIEAETTIKIINKMVGIKEIKAEIISNFKIINNNSKIKITKNLSVFININFLKIKTNN